MSPLLAALGQDTNPIPIKAALAHRLGHQAHYRLPLCPWASEQQAMLTEALANFAAG